MKFTEQLTDFAKALNKAQGAFEPIHKNKTMRIPGRPDYKYADLSDIIHATKTALLANGFCLPIGLLGKDEQGPVLTTILLHSSGQYLLDSQPIGHHSKHQEYGIEVTYKRRYAYCTLLGIQADDDVDGIQHEDKHHDKVPTPVRSAPGPVTPIHSVKPVTSAAVKADQGQRPITEDEWKAIASRIKHALKCDKEGIVAFVLKRTGKTSPKTLTYLDLLALDNEIGLMEMDRELPL